MRYYNVLKVYRDDIDKVVLTDSAPFTFNWTGVTLQDMVCMTWRGLNTTDKNEVARCYAIATSHEFIEYLIVDRGSKRCISIR